MHADSTTSGRKMTGMFSLLSSSRSKVFLLLLISFALVLIYFKLINNTGKHSRIPNVRQTLSSLHSTGALFTRTFYGYIGKQCPTNNKRKEFIALLRHWDSFATRNNIEYVLAMGSLLGQYRDGDVIPWDEDIDVLVDVTYFKTLQRLAQERNFRQGADREFHLVVHPEFQTVRVEDDRQRWNCEGKKVKEQVDSCSFVQPLARLVCGYNHVDIFHFTLVAGNMLDDPDAGTRYNRTDFYPFVRCNFMNVATWCPNNRKKVLEKRYRVLKAAYICKNGQWMPSRD